MKLFGKSVSASGNPYSASSGLIVALVVATAFIGGGAQAVPPPPNTMTVMVAPFSNTDKLRAGGFSMTRTQ